MGAANHTARVEPPLDPCSPGIGERAEAFVGTLAVAGRYHCLPRRVDDDYELSDTVLGDGCYGKVLLATCRASGREFAVKRQRLRGMPANMQERVRTEAAIHLTMDSPHVVRVADVYECDDFVDIVIERLAGGELLDHLMKRDTGFSERRAASVVRQILLAVSYIHSHGVCHRDLKLENFMYEDDDNDHLQLIDFGFSALCRPGMPELSLNCGSAGYAAPEVYGSSLYDSQCDIWSVGVIVFTVLTGSMPFGFTGSAAPEMSDLFGDRVWRKLSPDALDFVRALLQVDAQMRLTAEEALRHPWIVRYQAADAQPRKADGPTFSAFSGFSKLSPLQRACRAAMSWSMTPDDMARVRDAFLRMDRDDRGGLSLADMQQALAKRFRATEAEVEPMFEALDLARTWEVSYSAYLATTFGPIVEIREEHVRATFCRLDRAGRGYLVQKDLEEVLGSSVEGDDLNRLLEERDFTGTGKLSRGISYECFDIYLRSASCSRVSAGPIMNLLCLSV